MFRTANMKMSVPLNFHLGHRSIGTATATSSSVSCLYSSRAVSNRPASPCWRLPTGRCSVGIGLATLGLFAAAQGNDIAQGRLRSTSPGTGDGGGPGWRERVDGGESALVELGDICPLTSILLGITFRRRCLVQQIFVRPLAVRTHWCD